MDNSQAQAERISRRGLFILGAQFAGLAGLVGRARFLQIDQNDRYFLMAEDNRIATLLEPAPRGIIFDSNGVRIAENAPNFRVEIRLEHLEDAEVALAELSRLIPLEAKTRDDILSKIEKSTGVGSMAVADHLSWAEFSLVNENLPVLPGIQTRIAQSRIYPYHEIMCHQIGYVRRVSKYDLEQMTEVLPIYRTPDMVIGKTGIEAVAEEKLRGVEGRRDLEQNAHQHVMREINYQQGVPGDEIETTLDLGFHHYANERLRGEAAAAVVMEVKTGDVKLLASAPSYDPNPFVFGISQKQYNELLENPLRPLPHKAIAGQYPPASTFKMVTALAALEAGTIDHEAVISCRGKIKRGRDFYCWKSSGHGAVNLRDSLKHSCDVYYYTLAERTGIAKISAMAKKLGLGESFDIAQTNVLSGLIPTKDWKARVRGEKWMLGDSLNAGIGQGYVLTTPLQLAVMTARIASGKAVFPNLISKINGALTRRRVEMLDIDQEHLRHIRQGLFAAVNENQGTGYSARISGSSGKWAGKTGTAQVRNISKAERARGVRKNEQLERKLRDHALFVAFAPAEDPKYAVAVVVEHGGSGSSSAAPIARDLMLYALHGGLPPLEAYPSKARGAAKNFMASVPPLESIKRDPLAEHLNPVAKSDPEEGEASG